MSVKAIMLEAAPGPEALLVRETELFGRELTFTVALWNGISWSGAVMSC